MSPFILKIVTGVCECGQTKSGTTLDLICPDFSSQALKKVLELLYTGETQVECLELIDDMYDVISSLQFDLTISIDDTSSSIDESSEDESVIDEAEIKVECMDETEEEMLKAINNLEDTTSVVEEEDPISIKEELDIIEINTEPLSGILTPGRHQNVQNSFRPYALSDEESAERELENDGVYRDDASQNTFNVQNAKAPRPSTSRRRRKHQVSISSTFYERLLCTEVFFAAFFRYSLPLYFLAKEYLRQSFS